MDSLGGTLRWPAVVTILLAGLLQTSLAVYDVLSGEVGDGGEAAAAAGGGASGAGGGCGMATGQRDDQGW